jgi:hypothetical protein
MIAVRGTAHGFVERRAAETAGDEHRAIAENGPYRLQHIQTELPEIGDLGLIRHIRNALARRRLRHQEFAELEIRTELTVVHVCLPQQEDSR